MKNKKLYNYLPNLIISLFLAFIFLALSLLFAGNGYSRWHRKKNLLCGGNFYCSHSFIRIAKVKQRLQTESTAPYYCHTSHCIFHRSGCV